MKTQTCKLAEGGWQTRSVLECGSPLPLLTRGGARSPLRAANAEGHSFRQRRRARSVAPCHRLALLLCFFILSSAFCLRVLGQSYSIDWYKIAGGGGTSTNGQYTITGTIGQPDASGAMSGGNYSVTGGFWAIYAVQTPGLPKLTITFVGPNSVKVSWPYTGNYILLQNPNLATGTWTPSSYPITTANGTSSVTVTPLTENSLFFRLTQ